MARHKYDKVAFEYPVKEIHGKPCSHTKTYFAVNGFTGKPYISRLCNPSTKVTSLQIAQRQQFRSASNYAKGIMADSTKQAAAEARMGTNSKYTQLRNFLMAEFMAGNGVE